MIPGPPGSRAVCINGAATHLVKCGDLVIIAAYGYCSTEELREGITAKVLVAAENVVDKHCNDIGTYKEIHFEASDSSHWTYATTDVIAGIETLV